MLFETWLVPIEAGCRQIRPASVVLVGGIPAPSDGRSTPATTLNGYYLGMIVAGIGAGGLRQLRRQCAEMVSDKRGPPRHHRCRFRRRLALIAALISNDQDPPCDHLPLFRSGTRHHHRDPAFFLSRRKPDKSRGDAECERDQSRRNHSPTEVIVSRFDVLHVRIVGWWSMRRQPQADRGRSKVDSVPVTLMAMTMTAVTFAATSTVSSTV